MKLSVSLSEDDVAILDRYVEQARLGSRSAAVQKAIGLLRGAETTAEYAEAFAEWEQSEDGELWDSTSADGLRRAAG